MDLTFYFYYSRGTRENETSAREGKELHRVNQPGKKKDRQTQVLFLGPGLIYQITTGFGLDLSNNNKGHIAFPKHANRIRAYCFS